MVESKFSFPYSIPYTHDSEILTPFFSTNNLHSPSGNVLLPSEGSVLHWYPGFPPVKYTWNYKTELIDWSINWLVDWLTHYQTTNFRLFQTERVCRRQFQIWRKRQKVIQLGRKHYGKRRNCSLRAISPFPTVFSKGLFPRGVKRCHWMFNRLINWLTDWLID